MRIVTPILTALAIVISAGAYAQTGAGSLRGYARDESGAVLPGVTVTANSDALMSPSVAVSDNTGQYRILNLPPGDYVLQFEMPGFATYRQEGIVLRAGANYSVNATLKISSVQETITVTAETPMLEIASPSNVMNVEGEFQRNMPIQSRRNWSDFLELTPGIIARPFDDGSGRMVYFGHGTEHYHHALQLEGMNAANYHDAQATYVQMGSDMIEDVQVKNGGVEASEPLGTGMVINVVTKSGGNNFAGSVGFALQPIDWNADNSPAPSGQFTAAGTPTKNQVYQLDASIGGPIVRDKAWFFFALRYADLQAGISRTDRELTNITNYQGGSFDPFNNTTTSTQPYVKFSGKVNENHQVNAYWQNDRLTGEGNREYNFEKVSKFQTGGGLFGAKWTAVWGTNTTSQVTFGYNNKSGNDESTIDKLPGSGPQINIYESAALRGGRFEGSGFLLEGGNFQSIDFNLSSILMVRGDVTHYVEDFGGSHEFKTGIYAAPSLTRDVTRNYLNNGFVVEDRYVVDPNDTGSTEIPFHRAYYEPTQVVRLDGTDRDIGLYIQDAWKPVQRLTINAGLRLDWVNRYDAVFDISRMSNALALGPRFGFSYLVTEDARNVLRGSVIRVHEQVGGRDYATSEVPSSTANLRDEYDIDGDGNFETIFNTPAGTPTVADYEWDPDLHQPFINEAIFGFRKQFPKQLALDVAWIYREFHDRYTRKDVNGIYPDGPFQPFVNYGLIDPNRAQLWQWYNNDYDKIIMNALEITANQRIARKIQFMFGLTRQWQHITGDWNPTDPAGFVQPEAYPNDKLVWPTRGGTRESNSLSTSLTTLTYGPMWQKYSVRTGVTWNAPWGLLVAASYNLTAGPWTGPLLARVDANDPEVLQFGPSTVTTSTGFTASNPLAVTYRFVGPTRGDGQIKAPDIHALGLKVGKTVELGGTRELELSANIFNLFNLSDHWQYNYSGANQSWNSNYLQLRNLQPPLGLQLTFVFRY